MISKIVSILTVGVAALFMAVPANVYAVNAVQEKASIAALKKQLNALPLHKAVFGKVNSLLTQLVAKDPKNGAVYLKTALTKLSISNAKKNATALTKKVILFVNKSKTLTAKQKKSIIATANKLLKGYIPPGPNNPPYQAMVLTGCVAA